MPGGSVLQLVFWFLGSVAGALLGYVGLRFTARNATKATETGREARWNAAYRSAAERHLQWDFMILGRLQRLEHSSGIDEEIPQPPPLFPNPPKGEDHLD